MAAQFYMWYPPSTLESSPWAKTSTSSSSTRTIARHTRSHSATSSTAVAASPLTSRKSTSSATSSSTTSENIASASQASSTPAPPAKRHSLLHRSHSSRDREKQNQTLQKKHRRRSNPFRHARSNSTDSILPPVPVPPTLSTSVPAASSSWTTHLVGGRSSHESSSSRLPSRFSLQSSSTSVRRRGSSPANTVVQEGCCCCCHRTCVPARAPASGTSRAASNKKTPASPTRTQAGANNSAPLIPDSSTLEGDHRRSKPTPVIPPRRFRLGTGPTPPHSPTAITASTESIPTRTGASPSSPPATATAQISDLTNTPPSPLQLASFPSTIAEVHDDEEEDHSIGRSPARTASGLDSVVIDAGTRQIRAPDSDSNLNSNPGSLAQCPSCCPSCCPVSSYQKAGQDQKGTHPDRLPVASAATPGVISAAPQKRRNKHAPPCDNISSLSSPGAVGDTPGVPIPADTKAPTNTSGRPRSHPHPNSRHHHHHHHHRHHHQERKSGKLAHASELGVSFQLKHVDLAHHANHYHATRKMSTHHSMGGPGPYSRSESLSSASGTMSSLGARTHASTTGTAATDPSSSGDTLATRPFVARNGRAYLSDPGLVYPLPVDLAELHRQSLRTLLFIQVFGAPVCSPAFATRPPARVLEVGCGSGFWSMMCHRYFRDRGHPNISFTGLDIAPLAPGASVSQVPGASGGGAEFAKPDRDMNWRFVQHDMRFTPFPFQDGEFDLVMVKDMSMAVTHSAQQRTVDEYLRLLRPGGHLEIWESDHTIRMLRPHAAGSSSPSVQPSNSSAALTPATPAPTATSFAASSPEADEEHEAASALGAYVMTSNTPLSPPLNNYLVEYNSWLVRALELRDLTPVPCTLIGPMLLQESEELCGVNSRRLAIPLSEIRWEKEGVGGVVTKDGKSYIDTRGLSTKKKKRPGASAGAGAAAGAGAGTGETGRRSLNAAQAALRRTALLTVVQGIQGLEPVLREVSGKRLDEWDAWVSKMMEDLMGEGGTSWGECLEVGAWWAEKKGRRKM